MKKKTIRRIVGGLIGGTIFSGIWFLIFLIAIPNSYYGLVILPAIIISFFSFIVGAVLGAIMGGIE